jgi:dienelactone hydrolase
MPLLPPTVHERIARCGTEVALSGLVAGATAEVSVAGAVHTVVATGSRHSLTVAPLAAGDEVRARQDDGSGPTPWSPTVTVEDAAVPPTAPPQLPSEVGACSQCVHVRGMVPGCEVRLEVGGHDVGSGRADRVGEACVRVELERHHEETAQLTAHMVVCGTAGPEAATPIVPDPPLEAPGIGAPVYGCQRVVPLSGLRRGGKVRLETDSGTYLGWICSCWTAVNVAVLHALVTGERVRARQYWDSDPCKAEGPWSGWRQVVAPDEGIRPTVQEALVEGDQTIRVANQIPGGEIVVLIRDDPAAAAVRWGPRAAESQLEIMLAEPLRAGQQVAAEQRLCDHVEQSDWVTVRPPPAVVHPPVVVPPVHTCGGSVMVTGLHAGALVRLYQDGVPSGLAWAGSAPSVEVTPAAGLTEGAEVTARQWVGAVPSQPSAPVLVVTAEELHTPRVLPPVAVGDRQVVVSGVTPGALVSVRAGGVLVGERHAAESLVRVGVGPLGGAPVEAVTRLCDLDARSGRVEPITSPCATGPEAGSGHADLDYGTWLIPLRQQPGEPDDGGFSTRVRGRLYHPTDANGKLTPDVRNRPLVLIAHGLWSADEWDHSHLGYAWLAGHLARWGMFVHSIDLADINTKVWHTNDPHQFARAELILHTLDSLLTDSAYQGRFDRTRIGLVGHSMGGEAVVVASTLNQQRPDPYGIRGVVSFAPTRWRPDVDLSTGSYLQLHGSLDYLLGNSWATGAFAPFAGPRIYDHAWRHRTFAFVVGGRHQGWNPNWWNGTGGEAEGGNVISGSLTPEDHARIGRCLVNAFFQDSLFGRTEHRGFLEGFARPPSIAAYDVRLQHQSPHADVIDDFGDANPQFGFPAEVPPDKTVNRRGGRAEALGIAQADDWDDVEHVALARSVHDMRSTDLRWLQPTVVYESELPPLGTQPTDVLSLRVAQHFDEVAGDVDETWNAIGLDLDLLVELRVGGQTSAVRLGSGALVPYPAASARPLSVFRTVRLPLDAFTAVNPSLPLHAVVQVSVRLLGRPSGRVLVDDIEIAR